MNSYGRGACITVVLVASCVVTMGARAQKPIPIRSVTTLASTDSGVVANVYVLHAMSDGSVLLNDGTNKRLLLFDSTLKRYTIIADTAGEASQGYGTGSGGLLLFPSDSTAFVDRTAQALLIIDKAGKIARVTAPPKVADMRYFAGSVYGVPGFDAAGRLYYRAERSAAFPSVAFGETAPDTILTLPDSAPIIRADFETRRLDTVAMMKLPVQKYRLTRSATANGFFTMVNPLPTTDDWAHLSDGTVAIVRGQDYHIDWYAPDGTHRTTPKMPFDWRRVTDDDKTRMVDSVRRLQDSIIDAQIAKAASAPAGRGGVGMLSPAALESRRGLVVSPGDLPDYHPPIRVGSQIRADLDDNLWIVPSTSLQAKGGILIDVVNRDGEIVERVQLPPGRNLHGFAPGGIIYMSVPATMQAQFGWPRIERGRVERAPR